jgi:hypothetical protein
MMVPPHYPMGAQALHPRLPSSTGDTFLRATPCEREACPPSTGLSIQSRAVSARSSARRWAPKMTGGQAEIMQDGAKKEEFFIEPNALRSRGKGPENEGSENMLIYRGVALHLHQVQRCEGELAVWNPDSRDFTHAIRRYQNIVLALLEVAGTGCSTSQCSTILPSTSKRKISTPAVS